MPTTATGGPVTTDRPPPASGPPRRRAIVIGTAVAALCLGGLAGWFFNDASRAHHDVTVSDTFTGKVTLLNIDRTAGCVTPTNGAKVCSIFATFGEPLQVGDTVHVAHEVYKNRAGNGYDLLLVVPANAPG